jgi:hypothetical protein
MIIQTIMTTMNTKERIEKHLNLYFDWTFIRHCEFVMVSDDKLDYHMFMIYDSDGDLLHGFHIERIQ